MSAQPELPRGVRLCNPLCIERSAISYAGEIPSSDAVFKRFVDAPHGFRAGIELLRAYQRIDGVRTLDAAITRYSPPSDDNPTEEYAQNVAKACEVDMDEPIDFERYWVPILTAMSNQECGPGYFSPAEIQLAIELAGPS